MQGWRWGWQFVVPAACYFATNVVYLHALSYVPPPVWMLLIQTRTLYTALAYKVSNAPAQVLVAHHCLESEQLGYSTATELPLCITKYTTFMPSVCVRAPGGPPVLGRMCAHRVEPACEPA